MEVACANCGTMLHRALSQIKKQSFCNQECRKAHSRPSITCEGCGIGFPRRPTNPLTKYCTWDCFKASRWADVMCAECGSAFKKRISEIRKAEALGSKHMCSRACRNASTSKLLGGDGSWVIGGKHGAARKRGNGWPLAKAAALRRDDQACQQCGATGQLEVHHWEPYFISFDNSLDNLVTLCRGCHQDKHEEYRREGFYADLHR
jgi:hypothetical protein